MNCAARFTTAYTLKILLVSISLRRKKRIDCLLPGITGWAQVNGRDNLSIPEKVVLDAEYLNRQSLCFDIEILWMTIINVAKRKGVSH